MVCSRSHYPWSQTIFRGENFGHCCKLTRNDRWAFSSFFHTSTSCPPSPELGQYCPQMNVLTELAYIIFLWWQRCSLRLIVMTNLILSDDWKPPKISLYLFTIFSLTRICECVVGNSNVFSCNSMATVSQLCTSQFYLFCLNLWQSGLLNRRNDNSDPFTKIQREWEPPHFVG